MVQDLCPRMRRGGCGFCTAAGWAESSRVLWNSTLRVKSPLKTMGGRGASSAVVHTSAFLPRARRSS